MMKRLLLAGVPLDTHRSATFALTHSHSRNYFFFLSDPSEKSSDSNNSNNNNNNSSNLSALAAGIVSSVVHPQTQPSLHNMITRPPTPPMASDAKPFAYGTINRNPSARRRYVNANAAAAATPSPSIAEPPTYIASNNLTSNSNTNDKEGDNTPVDRASMSAGVPPVVVPMSQLTRLHATKVNETDKSGKRSAPAAEGCATPSSMVAKAKAAIAAHDKKSVHLKGDSKASPTRSGGATSSDGTSRSGTRRTYRERCVMGWSQAELFGVVSDVESYKHFLPWCLASDVHSTTTGGDGVVEMLATLSVGFSFFQEQYTSRVTLLPHRKVIAVLADNGSADGDRSASSSNSTTATTPKGILGALLDKSGLMAKKRSILNNLVCEWDFLPPTTAAHNASGSADKESASSIHNHRSSDISSSNSVEVVFSVSFEFVNPMYSALVVDNVVSLMTKGFERRCLGLYGPPSMATSSLPLHAS